MDKLRTYKMINYEFELEAYLEVLPEKKQWKSMKAFRISAHKLQRTSDSLNEGLPK